MTFKPDIFQQRALKTWYPTDHELHGDATPSVLGIVGESGEIAEKLKKMLFKPGYQWPESDQLDELGDIFYYVVIRAYQLGVTMEQLSVMNRNKLSGGKHGWVEIESPIPTNNEGDYE